MNLLKREINFHIISKPPYLLFMHQFVYGFNAPNSTNKTLTNNDWALRFDLNLQISDYWNNREIVVSCTVHIKQADTSSIKQHRCEREQCAIFHFHAASHSIGIERCAIAKIQRRNWSIPAACREENANPAWNSQL